MFLFRLTFLSMGLVMVSAGFFRGDLITARIDSPCAQILWFGLGATLLLLGAVGERR